MVISGKSPDRIFVEVVEVPEHPWFLACQFHPEFKSKPYDTHPLFRSFIGAAVEYRGRRLAGPELEEAEQVEAEVVLEEEGAQEEVTAAEPAPAG